MPARYSGRGRLARNYSRSAHEWAAQNRKDAEQTRLANEAFMAAVVNLFAPPQAEDQECPSSSIPPTDS